MLVSKVDKLINNVRDHCGNITIELLYHIITIYIYNYLVLKIRILYFKQTAKDEKKQANYVW